MLLYTVCEITLKDCYGIIIERFDCNVTEIIVRMLLVLQNFNFT